MALGSQTNSLRYRYDNIYQFGILGMGNVGGVIARDGFVIFSCECCTETRFCAQSKSHNSLLLIYLISTVKHERCVHSNEKLDKPEMVAVVCCVPGCAPISTDLYSISLGERRWIN